MTKAIETELPGGKYEQRYSLTLGGRPFLRFVRRPVSMPPEDGAVVFVDTGGRYGSTGKRGAATYRDGKFHHVKFEPTHWSELEHG